MYTAAMVIATSHILDLQAEAAANRLAKQAKRPANRSNRIAAAIASLRSLLTSPAEPPMALPKLTEYPFRS